MGSLLEYVQTQMQPEPGKATLADLVLARREMPDATLASMGAVPDCIVDDNGDIDPQRLAILAWIQMIHEKPDLTQDEVMQMISLAKGEAFLEFLKKIYWFWSDLDEDVFESRWQERMRLSQVEADITPIEGKEEEELISENPTPSPSS